MRQTQSTELNKKNMRSQVRTLSNNNKIYFFYIHEFSLFKHNNFLSLVAEFVLSITINIFQSFKTAISDHITVLRLL